MSAHISTAQFRCDWCGIYSAERILAPSGVIVETPLPDGWTAIGYGAAQYQPERWVELRDAYGAHIQHLCPACSARTAGDLITHLGSLPKKEAAA